MYQNKYRLIYANRTSLRRISFFSYAMNIELKFHTTITFWHIKREVHSTSTVLYLFLNFSHSLHRYFCFCFNDFAVQRVDNIVFFSEATTEINGF